jgi:hypothetical protein
MRVEIQGLIDRDGKASCAASSAISKSPTRRIKTAAIRPQIRAVDHLGCVIGDGSPAGCDHAIDYLDENALDEAGQEKRCAESAQVAHELYSNG